MSKPREMVRQGDVLLTPIDKIPAGAKPVARTPRGVVLAYGEVTGHAHTVEDEFAELMEMETERYLSIAPRKVATLVHEEHGSAQLTGNYKVTIQSEYTPAEVRRVAD